MKISEYAKEDITTVSTLMLGILCAALIAVIANHLMNRYDCNTYQEATGLPTVRTLFQCYVNIDGNLTQIHRYVPKSK